MTTSRFVAVQALVPFVPMVSTMTPAEAVHPPRLLSPNEKAFWRLDEGATLNFAMVAHVRPGLDAEAVRRALTRLQARHPLLRAHIELRGFVPWFVWPKHVLPIRLEEFAVGRDEWVPFFERDLRQALRWRAAPLARAVLLQHGDRGSTLGLVLHHSIADGYSGLAAVRDLLWEATTGKPASNLVYDRSLSCEDSLPSRARGVAGGFRRAALVAKMIGVARNHKDPLKCPVKTPAAPHERTYHLEPREFDVATTTALSARARAENSTVHGAVGAAMILGMARAAGVASERSVAFGSPINIRKDLDPAPGEQIGMFLSASQYVAKVSPTTRFWEVAKGIRERIELDLKEERPLKILPLLSLFYNSIGGEKPSPEEFGRKWAAANGTTGLTNLGRVDVEAPKGLTIERMHALVAPSALDIFNGVASSYGGSLHVTFNWCEPCFDRPGAIAMIDDMEATLRASVTGDPVLGSAGA